MSREYALKIRQMFGEGDAKRDAGLETPEDVERFDDIVYGHQDEAMQKLDVYRPKPEKGRKLPVILNVHGGGWVYGTKETYQFYCMSLAERGFAVVNFSYRLAPEWKYPASFEDLSAVAQWILDHHDEYGLDTDHVFGVGDSAGGQMLGMFAAALTNPDYQVPFVKPEGFAFQAIALNCGDYKLTGESDLDRQLMDVFLPEGGKEKEYREISSVYHITEHFPPSFIMSCPGDFMKEAPMDLIPALKEKDVPFVYRVYGSHENPLTHVFHCDIRLREAALCNEEECAFFHEFMK